MLTIQEAEKIIFQHILPLDTEGVALLHANERILAETLYADRDFPPFDRVTMDGIAIRFADFEQGIRAYKIIGIQAAGSPNALHDSSPCYDAQCYEVMTGAMLPNDFDTVIRYEDLKIEDGIATVLIDKVLEKQNIHKKGIDRKEKEALVHSGIKISSAEIATAATIGKSKLNVYKSPKVAIISTGDELVDIFETPLPYQIRRSNVYAIAAILETEFKIKAKLFHFNDDKTLIINGLRSILAKFHIVILSGAVSEGKFDFVPEALSQLGVEKLFHKVSQRPGKPFWFGIKSRKTKNEKRKTVVFALPGNPVSTFMCAYRYVVPFIQKSLGIEPPNIYARLTSNFSFKPALTYFLQVKLVKILRGYLKRHPLKGMALVI